MILPRRKFLAGIAAAFAAPAITLAPATYTLSYYFKPEGGAWRKVTQKLREMPDGYYWGMDAHR